ncbi:MAG: OmpH family outer membrane protein [Salibacteraceae bacterium]
MNLNRFQTFAFLFVAALLIGLNVWSIARPADKTKIRYVRSQEVVYGFLGMKEAQNEFELKRQGWVAQLDTLQQDFQTTLNQYSQEISRLSVEERSKREELLRVQQNNIAEYTQQVQQRIQEEENRVMTGVLNQVNAFAEKYALNSDCDIVLGTTSDGSILYGSDGHDVTDEFLLAMNQWYDPNAVAE